MVIELLLACCWQKKNQRDAANNVVIPRRGGIGCLPGSSKLGGRKQKGLCG